MQSLITITERDRLAELESAIDSALAVLSDAWLEIADALREIRDSKLYTLAGVTFEEYFSAKWPALGLARSTVYEWIDAAQVVRNVERESERAGVVIEPPKKISHALELKRLPPIAQPIALTKAREIASTERGAPEPTRYEISRAVAIVLEEPEPPSPDEQRRERQARSVMSTIERLWRSLSVDKKREMLEILGSALADEITVEPETTD